MGIKRYVASQDTTITDAYKENLYVRATGSNMGASDGNFAAAAGAKVLDGLGAVGGGAHAPNEWVSISSMQERSDFLHAFIKNLLTEELS